MKTVEIYTTPFCPYCIAAKRLLQTKGVAYVETDVSRDPSLRQAMMQRAGGRHTVPQIFIGGQPCRRQRRHPPAGPPGPA
jgi:glutaredoxin 3